MKDGWTCVGLTANAEEEPNDSDQTAKGDTREEGFTDRRGEVDE